MKKFTDDHEWLEIEQEVATVGITQYAVEQLGDLVHVDLPAIGSSFSKGRVAAVVESVKAASEIYAPLDGKVVAINTELSADPALINKDPMGKGWFFKLQVTAPDQLAALKSEVEYNALIGAGS